MSKTILSDVNGWTPLIDELVQNYGLVTASVFGRMWRYCQMDTGVCTAAQETIAAELSISRITVNRHIEILVRDGYLKDLSPDLKNKPHTYADTGKVVVKASISAVSESYSGVSESYSDGNAKLQPAVSESYSKKGVLRNNLRKNLREDGGATPPKQRDPLLDNPHVVLYKGIFHLTPNQIQRGTIASAVDNADLWSRVLTEWAGRGYNPRNVNGMIDAYSKGGLNGNGTQRKSKSDLAREAFLGGKNGNG